VSWELSGQGKPLTPQARPAGPQSCLFNATQRNATQRNDNSQPRLYLGSLPATPLYRPPDALDLTNRS
jgi:hypothetical protein